MNTDDLIRRQDVLARLEVNRPKVDKDSDRQRARMAQWKADREAVMSVAAQPEIIRCKDCKHSDIYYHCKMTNFWNSPDDFCSRAERRTDG